MASKKRIDSEIKFLQNVDAQIAKISAKISFMAVNPINESMEMKKFFASKNYNPQFKYEKYHANIDKLVETAQAIKSDKTFMGKILEEKKQEDIHKLLMLKTRGTEEFTAFSKEVYGNVRKDLLKKAKRLLYTGREKQEKNFRIRTRLRRVG